MPAASAASRSFALRDLGVTLRGQEALVPVIDSGERIYTTFTAILGTTATLLDDRR